MICALTIGNGHDGRDIQRVVNEFRFEFVSLNVTELSLPVRVLNHNPSSHHFFLLSAAKRLTCSGEAPIDRIGKGLH